MNTVSPLYIDFRNNGSFHITDIKMAQDKFDSGGYFRGIYLILQGNICCGYSLGPSYPGETNEIPEEIRV